MRRRTAYLSGALALAVLGLAVAHRDRAWRAVMASISTLGHTPASLLLLAVRPAWRVVAKLHKVSAKIRDLWNKQFWVSEAKATPITVLVIWSLVFVYHLLFPTFDPDEVAEFANRVAVQVVPPPPEVTGTGFWIDRRGYSMTCLGLHRDDVNRDRSPLSIGTLIPPVLGKRLIVGGATHFVPGQVVYYEATSGIAVVFVPRNPFGKRWRAFARTEGSNHVKEEIVEPNTVPSVSKAAIRVGDEIFIAAVLAGRGGMPGMSVLKAHVTQRVLDPSEHFHTDAAFEPSYLGAPVLNNREEVIGMVARTPDSTTVVIPATSVKEAFDKATLFH